MIPWNYTQFKQIAQNILEDNRKWSAQGKVADYIPELKKGDPNAMALVLASRDGSLVVGDCDRLFTLQSISKILTLMIALEDQGPAKVFFHVGKEPTGDPFNSIAKLETTATARPLNPMINAGAIAVCSLIKGKNSDDKIKRVLEFISMVVEREVTINAEVYQSEKETGHRNRALAYFMKDTEVLEGDVEDVLDLYFKQCAIEVSCEELAKIGLFIAKKGELTNGRRMVQRDTVRLVTTFMVTCGMYNASGEFAINAGIPAKSGVSGAIVAAVPNYLGIGTYGPALDEKGNSISGVHMLADLADQLGLSIF